MKPTPSRPAASSDPADSASPRSSRRNVVLGAGVAAGAAVAAAVLHRNAEPQAAVAVADAKPAPAQGYRLTDHVRRYYETTRS